MSHRNGDGDGVSTSLSARGDGDGVSASAAGDGGRSGAASKEAEHINRAHPPRAHLRRTPLPSSGLTRPHHLPRTSFHHETTSRVSCLTNKGCGIPNETMYIHRARTCGFIVRKRIVGIRELIQHNAHAFGKLNPVAWSRPHPYHVPTVVPCHNMPCIVSY